MIPIEPETPLTAKELRASVRGLEGQLSDSAQRGDQHKYASAAAELRATKAELVRAERREMDDAAAAHRLKADRARNGFDDDGTLKSMGYDSPGALVADRLKRGPVAVALETYLRDAGITPPAA